MALVIGVFKTCDHRLGRSHQFGKLFLGELRFGPDLVNELGNLGVDQRFVGQMTQLAVIPDHAIQDLHGIAGLPGLLFSLRHNQKNDFRPAICPSFGIFSPEILKPRQHERVPGFIVKKMTRVSVVSLFPISEHSNLAIRLQAEIHPMSPLTVHSWGGKPGQALRGSSVNRADALLRKGTRPWQPPR